jgi:4-hydroxy-3-methylbut-2-enyl diphosphate reductase IspH
MKIILAKDAGYCFGVRDAVNSAYEMSKKYGEAQLVEQRIRNAKVVGSTPISGTTHFYRNRPSEGAEHRNGPFFRGNSS